MKRLLLLTLVFMLTFGANVFADELCTGYYEADFPTSFVPMDISLFSAGDSLEDVLVDSWRNLAQQIDVSDFNLYISDLNDFADEYLQTLYKNPLLYYVSNGFRYRYDELTEKVFYIIPVYTETNKNTIKNTINEINKATDELLLCVNGNMSDFDKIMAVHDYMALNYEYDHSLENHSITIMTTKTGVCESYARAFYHVMDELDINCGFVTSDEMAHAWNIVELDGSWYHVDLTWDDPSTPSKTDRLAQVRHDYTLLSDKAIRSLDSPHYGYSLGWLEADSTLYDNAPWRGGVGSIVFSNGVRYYVKGDDLVNNKGDVIFKNLDGNDGGWSISLLSYFPSTVFAGLAEYNGILYFNTDKAIYSYDTNTGQTKQVLSEIGVCGLFVDKNTLKYSKYNSLSGQFFIAGRINLGDVRYSEPYYNGDELIVKIYKETNEPMRVFARGGQKIQSDTLTQSGLLEVDFDKAGDEQIIFYWDENLNPLREPEIIKSK